MVKSKKEKFVKLSITKTKEIIALLEEFAESRDPAFHDNWTRGAKKAAQQLTVSLKISQS